MDKVALFIDYYSIFISLQNIYNMDDQFMIEDKICEAIDCVCEYLKRMNKLVTSRQLYVLTEKYNEYMVEKFLEKAKTEVILVEDDRRVKTNEMKESGASRLDDVTLSQGVLDALNKKNIDSIMIISNDGDFTETGERAQKDGLLYIAGIMEAKCRRKGHVEIANSAIKRLSDLVIPIYDLLEGKDEGEPLVRTTRDNLNNAQSRRLEFYKNKEFLFRYPLNKKIISLGRRSIRMLHHPHIDLTDYDVNKVISRKHAEIIQKSGSLFLRINPECSRGTWIGKDVGFSGQEYVLQINYPILLGDRRDGILMVYRED